jgi:hypothetical protein
MAGISYFQRYSQRENHVTNNTLLVLRHIYQSAPAKFELVLRELLGQDKVSIGPSFRQQTRGAASTPDGSIVQAPFRLHIETKLGSALDPAQLVRHLDSIIAEKVIGDAYLLGLAREAMPQVDAEAMRALAKASGVSFASRSFADLVAALDAVCEEYDLALRAVLDDFIAFLASEKLLFDGDDWMLVAPCGTSFSENAKYGLYYDPADRPKRSPCAYFGAYRNKSIGLVGRIEAVLVCRYAGGAIEVVETERGAATPEALARIRGIMEETTYYDLRTDAHRFWVMDELVETNLIKQDKGPIRGTQYLQISPLLPAGGLSKGLTTRDLAARLHGRSFPAERT